MRIDITVFDKIDFMNLMKEYKMDKYDKFEEFKAMITEKFVISVKQIEYLKKEFQR